MLKYLFRATREVEDTNEVTTMAVDHPKKAAAGAKPKIAKAIRASTHPPFYEMVSDAIVTLKEKSGSSQYAIQKFTEEKYKQLPLNFRKQLLTQLKKFTASGKLVKVKNSYKLPAIKASAAPKPAAKPKHTAAAKKSTAKKAVAKAKPKTVAKPQSAASKPKAAAVKRMAVPPKSNPAKVSKKSVASSPSSKKAPAAAKTTKKAVAPVNKAAAPVKKAAAKPKKVKRLSSVRSPARKAAK